jgi:hypothetical protein
VERCGLDVPGSGFGPMAGCCKHGSEPPGCVRGWRFLDKSSDYELFKRGSAPRS